MRRFNFRISDIEHFIAESIRLNNLKDFGQILKGHDYNDDDTIHKSHFF